MENFNASIKRILEFAFENKTHSVSEVKKFVKRFSSDYIQVLDLKENTIFISSNGEPDHIFIQVKGVTYVVNYTLDGRRIIAATFADAQIFGLIEAVNGARAYRGTVITLSDSLLVKVNKELLLKAMRSDIAVASAIINYLAAFSAHSMEVSQNKAAISPYENLILYLYNKTLGKKLPYGIKDKKAFIADLLQVNKRTLYRYLDKLSSEGIISRVRQDIIVSQDNFDKIEKLFGSIHGF